MTSVVGGGSVVNGMFADRGSKADYGAWGALGNEGWGWDGLLPYFCKSTNFTPPSPGIAEDFDIQWDPEAYGQGPLQIDFSSMLYPDLRVKMISRNDGIVRKAYASKEVVLAAGAISTPKLLQLSGIGTTITLEEAGVKVKKEFAADSSNKRWLDSETTVSGHSYSRSRRPTEAACASLMNPVDRGLLLPMVRYIRDFNQDPLLAGYFPVETVPGESAQTGGEIMGALLATNGVRPTLAHPRSTCAMMPEEICGCVSSDLLVYGTDKLSVVDASIMPLIPATHLQTTVYAVAEKASDIIKSRHLYA
ncbi:hypothetical protein DL762_008554 [Monosporascus cannonballus]|uniref:Glucose-methanol-choline oxidoreductase N-terminal domain-containing protein n=1 Tax=Monosporascus cannonballus TaxID=155416 RepID=A0ABY0H0F8_9PEZI|nr:hypothetical protein DL762_008554 [Monosporascus cannonballus]